MSANGSRTSSSCFRYPLQCSEMFILSHHLLLFSDPIVSQTLLWLSSTLDDNAAIISSLIRFVFLKLSRIGGDTRFVVRFVVRFGHFRIIGINGGGFRVKYNSS